VCANAVAYALISPGSVSRNFDAYAPKDESGVRGGWAVADEPGVGEAFWVSFVQPKRKIRNLKNKYCIPSLSRPMSKEKNMATCIRSAASWCRTNQKDAAGGDEDVEREA
jgi:hypothetical protein